MDSSADADQPVPRMLEGVRVVDVTQYLAGPTVTRLMAELGADIVKVEQAPHGDPARTLPWMGEGRSAYFVQQNRGKRSVCVDFTRPEGADVVRDLVRGADVLVENTGPGVLESGASTTSPCARSTPAWSWPRSPPSADARARSPTRSATTRSPRPSPASCT